jgi:excisionase family DNA binding protein
MVYICSSSRGPSEGEAQLNRTGQKPEMPPLAVDFRTGAKLTSLSPFTLRAYVRSGKLRGTRCGRRWLIPLEELKRLVREGVL